MNIQKSSRVFFCCEETQESDHRELLLFLADAEGARKVVGGDDALLVWDDAIHPLVSEFTSLYCQNDEAVACKNKSLIYLQVLCLSNFLLTTLSLVAGSDQYSISLD